MKKWWVLGFGSGYALTAFLMLAGQEYVFLGGLKLALAPFFELFLWTYSLLSGLAVGILVQRKLHGRSPILTLPLAALVACLVSAFQFSALFFWAAVVLYLGMVLGYEWV